MKKQLLLLLSLTAAAGLLCAQNTDTTATAQTDTLTLSPSAKALEEVKITAQRPLYAVDGEKQIYNTVDDPSVQTGTASDALQNAPGVEVDAEGNITLRGTSSVDVWINDRPSNLSDESLRQYIKTLPANSIARIEVITNPSARYGSGGPVVNIVTNKKILRNEFLSLGATGNHRPQVSPWLSYVYSNKRFSINAYAEYDYSHTWSDHTSHTSLLTPGGDTAARHSGTSHSDSRRHAGYLYVGGHYQIDTARTLSFWAGAYPSRSTTQASSDMQWTEHIYSPGDYSYRHSLSSRSPQGDYYGGLDFTHRLDTNGQRLWIRASTNGFRYNYETVREYRFTAQPGLDHALQDLTAYRGGNRLSAEVGYSLPFAQHWELVTGLSGNIQFPQRTDTERRHLPSGSLDTLRSYSRAYRYGSYAGYLSIARRFGPLTAKAGLRIERLLGTATYSGYISDTTYANNLFATPTLHLSYSSPSMHNFTLSYTHRSNAPSATDLTRFIFYDEFNYSILGNPDLLPTHTHNLEGGWDKYFEHLGSVGVELYYKANTNQVESLTDVAYHPFYGREVVYTQPFNIGNSHTVGADLNLTYRPTAMFNLRFSAALMHQGYHAQFRPGQWADDNLWVATTQFRVWAKLWNVLQVFGRVRYATAQASLLSRSQPLFTTDLGLSADLIDRHLSLYLNVKDLFASKIESSVGTNPYLSSDYHTRYSSRYISLGLSLRFGKMELESRARSHQD